MYAQKILIMITCIIVLLLCTAFKPIYAHDLSATNTGYSSQIELNCNFTTIATMGDPQQLTTCTRQIDEGRVVIKNGNLFIDGEPVLLYGGELQYFRIRDENYDPEITKALWAETLDYMKSAGMNFVSFYIPWDYHELDEGTFDFTGARDLDYLLNLCYQKGFYVLVRPGPYIYAEWPYGPGSMGAVPSWFKSQYPETLCIKSDGSTYHQPTYMHPTFLAAVQNWYEALAPIFHKYIYEHPCIIFIQLDNEPNFFWEDHYNIDYSDTMIQYYHNYLELKYGTIDNLNFAYRSNYTTFTDVLPPTEPLSEDDTERIYNCWHWDWHDAAQAYITDYLNTLRNMFVELEITEPDIHFITNDGVHTIPFRNMLLWDGIRKNLPGLATLDIYPKIWPTNTHLMDTPFAPGYYTKLFAYYSQKIHGTGGYTFGPEIQGGWFTQPPTIDVRETAQLLTKLIGHGFDGIGMYVMRGGYNLDNTVYDFQAAISPEGELRDRYYVYQTYGTKLIIPFGEKLINTIAVENNEIAIATYSPYKYPQGGIPEDMIGMFAHEYAGLFGWLINSGYNPTVIDLALESITNLSMYKCILFLNPGFIAVPDAMKLMEYVEQGGTLVTFLYPGEYNLQWYTTAELATYRSALYPADYLGLEKWTFTFGDWLYYELDTGEAGEVYAYWYETRWSLADHPECVPFLYDPDTDDVIGYFKPYGNGRAYFIGTYLSSDFNRDHYYEMDDTDISNKKHILQWILDFAGVNRILWTDTPHEEVWARARFEAGEGCGECFIFIVNDHGPDWLSIHISNLTALGLDSEDTYRIEELLTSTTLADAALGSQLLQDGVSIYLDEYKTAIIHIYTITPEVLSYVSGSNQTGIVDAHSTQPLVVKVTTKLGMACENVYVYWQLIEVPPSASLAYVSDTITVTNQTGIAYTYLHFGNKTGEYIVEASCPAVQDPPVVFTLHARPGTIARIQLSLAELELPVGATYKFTAIGYDKFDNPVYVPSSYWNWSVASTTIGIINETGYFKALTVGETYVYASYGTVTSWGVLVKVIDITPPEIIAYSPVGVNISLTTPIIVTFSEPMMKSAVWYAFRITPSVNGSIIWDSPLTMIFTPEHEYLSSTTYTVTIGAEATDSHGVPMREPVSWQFTTMAVPYTDDTTAVNHQVPPQILTYSPTGIAVPLDTIVIVHFSKVMVHSSVITAFSIIPSLTGKFEWIDTSVNSTFIFIPARELQPSTTYTITISTEATDIYGLNLQSSVSWNFTTVSTLPTIPKIISYRPTGNRVALVTEISITFDRAMNQNSVESAFNIIPPVRGRFVWLDESTMTFLPDALLSPLTTYTVTLHGEAMDMYGTKLNFTFSWKFTTGTQADKDELDTSERRKIVTTIDQALIFVGWLTIIILSLIILLLIIILKLRIYRKRSRRGSK